MDQQAKAPSNSKCQRWRPPPAPAHLPRISSSSATFSADGLPCWCCHPTTAVLAKGLTVVSRRHCPVSAGMLHVPVVAGEQRSVLMLDSSRHGSVPRSASKNTKFRTRPGISLSRASWPVEYWRLHRSSLEGKEPNFCNALFPAPSEYFWRTFDRPELQPAGCIAIVSGFKPDFKPFQGSQLHLCPGSEMAFSGS
jgi:hypothetical protein